MRASRTAIVAVFSLLALMAAITITPSAVAQAAKAPARPAKKQYDPARFKAKQLLVVHYARADGDYAAWNLWAWPRNTDGAQINFTDEDAFGRIAVVPLKESADDVGFIVRKGEWERKDIDGDRFVPLGGKPVTEVWLVSGDAEVHRTEPVIDRTLKVKAAFVDDRSRVLIATSTPLTTARLKSLKVEAAGKAVAATAARATVPGTESAMTEVRLSRPLRDEEIASVTVKLADAPAAIAYARGVLEDPTFFAADARLGAECTKDRTVFRTWSPVSSAVELCLFDTPTAATPSARHALKRAAAGTWEATIPGDLHGRAYAYRFTHYGADHLVPDIHCFAATADSTRSIAVDLARAEPANWSTTPAPRIAQATDEILYEAHVRDFSVADESCPKAERGTYLGLIHSGTAPDGSPTGLAYLRRLGITALHLMPVHDFTAAREAYNWGYWTALFNVPEGNYASDATDPVAPVRELRTAIQGLHAAGIRVILDVVYNHTSSSGASSPFDGTVPYWFFRTTPDGRYTNDAGCGNSVADERTTVRKYMLDSLAFWLRAYNVDGFRFDLLGTHTPETVRAICTLVKGIRPDATLYGEPWTGGGPTRFGKGAQKGLPIAVFNDDIRGAIRGDTDGAAPGFATGKGGTDDGIGRGVRGSIDTFAQEPAETINYASAHDNLSLVDKIAKSAPAADSAARRAMQKLAIGIVLVAQGIPFIEGGSEMCRTKGGNHNSYEAGDAVNRFDWAAAQQCHDVSDWVAGMIALRKAHPAFRMDDDAEVRASLRMLDTRGTIAWTIDGAAAKDPARQLFVALNGDAVRKEVALPGGRWNILADGNASGTASLRTVMGKVELAPYSMIVAAQE